jgi:hypothetical protein
MKHNQLTLVTCPTGCIFTLLNIIFITSYTRRCISPRPYVHLPDQRTLYAIVQSPDVQAFVDLWYSHHHRAVDVGKVDLFVVEIDLIPDEVIAPSSFMINRAG